jgi:lipid-A-disaccharide synthase
MADVKLKLFFSAGEPSGDLHGANLIGALERLNPVDCLGFGGPRMAAAGCRLLADLTELAVMGVRQVVTHLGQFRKLYRQAVATLRAEQPDAVILIDYPGFNWWIARAAKRLDIPVIYYGVPQLWAWASWRVAKMRRWVDVALCKLPFEAEWYRARGCRAEYVGHPYFDELFGQRPDTGFINRVLANGRPLVTVLPGSRRQEIRYNLPWFVRAAEKLTEQLPHVRFAVAALNESHADLSRRYVAGARAVIDVHAGRTPELIRAADCCWACSGSVSLELLFHEKPSVILYWVPALQYYLIRYLLIRVPFITLVNLMAFDDVFQRPLRPYNPEGPEAELVPFPEYPTCGDCTHRLVAHAYQWLTDEQARHRKITQLSQLKHRLAVPGASKRAAQFIVSAVLSGGKKSAARDAA